MADVEITIGQHVCELVFGVNVTNIALEPECVPLDGT